MASLFFRICKTLPNYARQSFYSQRFFSDAYRQAIAALPHTQVTTLDKNGFRIASENVGTPITTVGLYIDSGLRYENEEIAGMTHFLEHLLFAGTKQRPQTKLEAELDSLGVELKAKAGREHLALYANCLTKDVPKVVEILADIVQNSSFEEKDIEKVRSDILLELKERENNPKKVVMDYLHSFAYQQTPLGLPKIGSTKSISEITKQNILDYARDTFLGPRVILASSGGVDHDELASLGKKYFESLKIDYKGEIPVFKPYRYTGGEIRDREDDMYFAYICLAVEGPGWDHPDYLSLRIGQYLIGSWDITHGGRDNTSQRLATYYIQEKLSVKKFETFYKAYQGTGLFGQYFVSEFHDVEDIMPYFHEELMRVCKSVFDSEVDQAKAILRSQILNRMLTTETSFKDIGSQVLRYNARQHPQELDIALDKIKTADVQNAIYEYVYDRPPAVVGYGNCEALPEYGRTRTRMFQFTV